MAKPSHRRALLLSLLISGVCVAVLLRHIDVAQSWRTLTQVSPRHMLLPLAIFIFATMPLRALRWQVIFQPASRPGFWRCLQVLAIGNAVNNLLPARAGDLARCVLIGGDASGGSEALGTVGIEKLLDGLALLAVVLFSLWFLTPPHWVLRMSIVSALCFGSAWVVLFLLRFRAAWLVEHVRRLPVIGERLAPLMAAFAKGLQAVTSAHQTVRLLLLTAGVWLADAALIWSLAAAFHLALAFPASIVISAILGLGQTIPAAPASVGTYEFFGVAAFGLVGVASSRALAFTVALHAWVFLAVTGFGLACIISAGLRFAQIRDVSTWTPAKQPGNARVAVDVTAAELHTNEP